MDTNSLKGFAQEARLILKKQVSIKIDLVLDEESSARRENPKAIKELENKINSTNKDKVIDQVAYTWFNRFTALQFMDVNGYNRVRVIASADNQTRSEIMSDASAGVFDDNLVSENTKNIVTSLLDGRSSSTDPDNEAYRYLIVSACNYWHSSMPFLFEKIADYTELLMPDDLLSNSSILMKLRDAMTPENCEDVEVIGWLYQFYISEKKDEVFEDLKKNQKVRPENIPAATQLFTPHWIVKYLVENSLGRLWMLNNPNSSLVNQMEYYIAPEELEKDFLNISSPEEIKICDPACGSGHMLTYSFDLLYAIYEEEGYDPPTIPTMILQNNLYGIELDQRAGELTAFALTMKAQGRHRGFLRNPIQPNICVLENIKFEPQELEEYMTAVGRDLFTTPLRTTLTQFQESDNFGSLIQPALQNVDEVLQILQSKDLSENLFLKLTHDRVLKVLKQVDFLSQKYHVVVANPPYMGGNGMNGRMVSYLKDNYPDVKSDLFSAFMVRNTKLTLNKGQLGFMTPFVWMFLSTYEKLRIFLLERKTITSLIQLEYSGFDGATVPICTFTFQNDFNPNFKGGYIKLSDFRGSANQAPRTLEAIKNKGCDWFYRVSSFDFIKVPGRPIAFWANKSVFSSFSQFSNLASFTKPMIGMRTGDNERFLRIWYEVNLRDFGLNFNNAVLAKESRKTWFPYNKGGTFRKWYGNNDFIVKWKNDGYEIKSATLEKYPQLDWDNLGWKISNEKFFFKKSITWTTTSSSHFGVRHSPEGFIFDSNGSSCFPKDSEIFSILGNMASKPTREILKILNPTIAFQPRDIGNIPQVLNTGTEIQLRVQQEIVPCLIKIAQEDWNIYETSWNFKTLAILSNDYRFAILQNTYNSLRTYWQGMTNEMLRLEEENNRIFIDAYGMQDELTPDVPIHEITLTCNPAYRYGKKTSKEVQEERLREDTMKEFISYAIGCMFGRYALEEPGLILANAGETLEDYLKKIPNPSFSADDDNVIPVLDGDWFDDDVTERFRKFLRITFGEENFAENLRFIETSLGKDIRKYFLKDFYKDHVQTYKKRPIYWQFSSPKGSFNVLIYMHRYNRDTVSVILDQYLREFKVKLTSQKSSLEQTEISADATQGEKSKAMNDIQKINSIIDELETWERDVIYPLATQRLEIDLDDGVKVNYPKFGTALTKITGLS